MSLILFPSTTNITDQGIGKFAGVLGNLRRLKELKMEFSAYLIFTRGVLNFSRYADITETGITAICENIQALKSLKGLSLKFSA